jgi:two-component system, cell cycle sensor histidine kinase and response regulator CckA
MHLNRSRPLRVFAGLRVPRLAIAVVLLLVAYIGALLVFGHSPFVGEMSDWFLLASSGLAMLVCFATSRRSHGIAQPFWFLTGTTLASWSLGKCFLLYDSYYLGLTSIRIVPLLFFFLAAAPMFVAVFISDDDFRGTINWEWILDATQVLVLILIIYLFLVYVPLLTYGEKVVSPIEDRLLLWRNIFLAVGLLTRAVLSRSSHIRRLYLPVALIVGVFAASSWIANRAQELSNAPETAWYDLGWSIPFCMLALAAAFWKESPEEKTVPLRIPDISRVIFAYLPSLLLPVMLLMKYRDVLREQIFLGLFGLMFSIVLFNARLVLTQRRQRLTMEALHASEHQYSSLFERNMAGVFRTTRDGRLVDCNPAFANMFGYAREELRGISMSQLYFGGAEEREEWIQKLSRTGPCGPSEFCLCRKDGSRIWVVQNANIEKQSDGSELLEGTLVDITERKLTTLAIEEWKRRYDAAVLASGQIIYESDPESNRVTLGGCVREILGYSAEELSGDARSWLALIHPEDSAYYLERVRSATTTSGTIEFEYRARRRNNGYRILWEQGRAVLDASGRVVRVVGFVSDITERRALESQLRQAQKMEAIGRLAGGVAHDFNNLLTIINGYSAMQIGRTDPADPVHHEAEQIKAAADRAAALTQQLLAFSRQQVLQPRRLNLNDIVRNVDGMLRRLIGEHVEILTALAPDLGTVKVDPGQVDQVLMNLVVNARDAMPNGGKVTIQTENVELDENYARNREYVNPGPHVLLAVSDSGTGMDPETQARMFEPFFTTKEPGKGTGLGLPMVYGIVKQSGGSIEVYTELNHGTSIKIYLPRLDAPVEQVSSPGGSSGAVRGSERILLMEDDELLRQLVVEVLTAVGYAVHAVEKPAELDAILQKDAPCDLLLTDVIMPKLDGPQLAKRVLPQWPGIKVLYMSGYTTDAIVHHGVLDEGLFFLQKPFTPTLLAAKVREVLDAPSGTRTPS